MLQRPSWQFCGHGKEQFSPYLGAGHPNHEKDQNEPMSWIAQSSICSWTTTWLLNFHSKKGKMANKLMLMILVLILKYYFKYWISLFKYTVLQHTETMRKHFQQWSVRVSKRAKLKLWKLLIVSIKPSALKSFGRQSQLGIRLCQVLLPPSHNNLSLP